jgi:hypothetical protein
MKFSEMDELPPEIAEVVDRAANDPDFGVAMGRPKRKVPRTGDYQHRARNLVYDYVYPRLEKTDTARDTFSIDDVYVVWFAKVLQNWKCLISTNLPDGMYYEVTYNGDRKETYIDAYKKFDNFCVEDYTQ